MKKFLGKTRETMRQYWNEVMHSTHKRMSEGAQYINKIITRARNENWRRKEKKK